MVDNKFADYVKDLMGVLPTVNGNPMLSATSMTDDNARYREDPFYISRERKRLAEEAAKAAAARSGMGMMSGGGSDSPMGRNAIQEREDALRAANLPEDEVQAIMAAEQEARGRAINDFLTNLSKGGLFGIASQLLGGTLVAPGMNAPVETRTGKTPAQIAQEQREAEAAAVAARAAEIARQQQISINADPYTQVPFTSADYYTPQDRSSYSDYQGAGQAQMDRSLQTQSDFYG